jgi:hypothetical protein
MFSSHHWPASVWMPVVFGDVELFHMTMALRREMHCSDFLLLFNLC